MYSSVEGLHLWGFICLVISLVVAAVRENGLNFSPSLTSWQRPEIRHNLGEKLSLADPIKNNLEVDIQRKERAKLWQSAHCKWS